MSVLVDQTRQRRAALIGANEIRLRGVDVCRYLKTLPRNHAARAEAAQILRDCPTAISRMKLYRFLEAIPQVGPQRVRRICQQQPSVWPLRLIGDLTFAERERLAQRIEGESND